MNFHDWEYLRRMRGEADDIIRRASRRMEQVATLFDTTKQVITECEAALEKAREVMERNVSPISPRRTHVARVA